MVVGDGDRIDGSVGDVSATFGRLSADEGDLDHSKNEPGPVLVSTGPGPSVRQRLTLRVFLVV